MFQINHHTHTTGPTLQCRNIYVLPGVPQFFEAKVVRLAAHLATAAVRSVTYKVVLSVDETQIVETLNAIVLKHGHVVTIGSYPFVDHPDCLTKTVVTMEANEGPALFEGDTRISIRKRSELLQRQVSLAETEQQHQDAEESGIANDGDAVSSPTKITRNNSTAMGLFTKEEMDLHVNLALADLIALLPEGSVLRTVANEDGLQ
jgi:molybdopterin-biosynthesis enzyme MoeA-like protein